MAITPKGFAKKQGIDTMNILALPRYLSLLQSDKNFPSSFYETSIHAHLVDTLNRLERHHLLLTGSSSEKINLAIVESTIQYLYSTNRTSALRSAHFFFCDANQILLDQSARDSIEDTLHQFKQDAEQTQKMIVFVVNQIDFLLKYSGKFLQSILLDQRWRVIIFSDAKHPRKSFCQLEPYFSIVKSPELNEPQLFDLLTLNKHQLENYHQVTIPDETILSALMFSKQYLPSLSHFDKAFELLDTAASRISNGGKDEGILPIVTDSVLSEVISHWTGIQNIQTDPTKFNPQQFANHLQQIIFGQDKVITSISRVLQRAYLNLPKKQGPLCSFLFVGPAEVGKTELAYGMAKQLFGNYNALLSIRLNNSFSSLKEIAVIMQGETINLLDAIRQRPYAIILIEDIQSDHLTQLSFFKDIFQKGYVIDQEEKYDFSHAIIIMTTRLGSDPITRILNPQQQPEQASDLLQLILNENVLDIPGQIQHSFSPDEICSEMMPLLEKLFMKEILNVSHIMPFIALDFTALEKIIRIKIKLFIKEINKRFGIEMSYANEIVKFLAHEAYWKKSNKTLDNLLEQHLYSCVAQELISNNSMKNRSKRVVLQLNESGQLLKCDFVMEPIV